MSAPPEIQAERARRERVIHQAARNASPGNPQFSEGSPKSANLPNRGQHKPSLVYSLSELMEREFPERKMTVESLLVESTVSLIVAPPKMGKTMAALNIGLAVASGGRAFGSLKVEQGRVLGLFLEDGQRRLQERARFMLGSAPVSDNFFIATEWQAFPAGLEALEQCLQARPDTRLIIIDTLKRVRPRENPNARLYDSDYNALGPLSDLAHQYNVSVLVVHHTRKAQSDDPMDLVSGSTGLTGAVDSVMVLKRTRGEADATLHVMSRDFEDREFALRWDKELMGWSMMGDAAEFRLSGERREIVELLRKSTSPMTPRTIASMLGRNAASTRKLLWTMHRDGELHGDDRGRYSLNGKPSMVEEIYIPASANDSDVDRILNRVI